MAVLSAALKSFVAIAALSAVFKNVHMESQVAPKSVSWVLDEDSWESIGVAGWTLTQMRRSDGVWLLLFHHCEPSRVCVVPSVSVDEDVVLKNS